MQANGIGRLGDRRQDMPPANTAGQIKVEREFRARRMHEGQVALQAAKLRYEQTGWHGAHVLIAGVAPAAGRGRPVETCRTAANEHARVVSRLAERQVQPIGSPARAARAVAGGKMEKAHNHQTVLPG
jgi:hypothetical protein